MRNLLISLTILFISSPLFGQSIPKYQSVNQCVLQTMMEMKLKSRIETIMSICLTWVPFSELGEPNIYHDSGCITRKWDSIRREHQICGTLYFLRI